MKHSSQVCNTGTLEKKLLFSYISLGRIGSRLVLDGSIQYLLIDVVTIQKPLNWFVSTFKKFFSYFPCAFL